MPIHDEANYGLPARLRSLRTRSRMNRLALGECCGLSKNMIALYENGQTLPSVDSLVALADFFDVSTDFLLGRDQFPGAPDTCPSQSPLSAVQRNLPNSSNLKKE